MEKCGALLMAWVKIDDNAPHHRKMLLAGPVACWLWVCGLAYANRHATDGLIPGEAVPFLGCKDWHKAVPKLTAAGLWIADGPRGYRIHDFLHWNDSAATRKAKAAESAERVAAFRNRKHRPAKHESNTVTTASSTSGCNAIGNTTPLPQPLPVQEQPPLPPSGEGGRLTRRELADASADLAHFRDNQPEYVAGARREPGRHYPDPKRCPHEPEHDDEAVCLALLAYARRERIREAVAS